MDNNLKRFIDRADFITDFKQQCNDLQNEPDKIKVISYYGYGVLGKTALLQHLMEPQNKINGFDYIYHDFDSIVDMRGVLKKLKRRLSQIGCEFPLFEMGNYLYEISIGENSLPPQNKSFLSDYPFISNVLNLSLATFTMASSGGVAAAFAAADVAQKVQPVMEEIFNTVLKKLNIPTSNRSQMAHRIKVRKYIEELKKQGENRPENQLENDLPKLFAQDLSYWTANQNRKVVIFLDSYDILKNKGRKTKEHPEPDWWLKGEDEFALGGKLEGLLLSIPNVVWVLSGRNELKFEGYLGEKIHQKEIQPFNNIYSLQFLQSRGITNNDELCAKITKLTQGYPLYLELCSQQYRMLKKKDKYHEPEISDFGSENEEFSRRVGEIVLNLIECVDDTGIREMIKYLCAIGTWTDELAGKIVPLLNETAYNIIKDFSFIRTRAAEEDNLNEIIYRFDSIVQDILIVKYKRENKFVVGKTIENTNAYFSDMFKDVKFDSWREDDDKIVERNLNLSLKLWATIIVKLNDSAERLMQIYETYFDKLTDSRRFRNTADEVVNQFFNKVKIIAKPNKAPYAYFEYILGIVKLNQSRDKEALELAESAYNKFNKFYGKENKYTIESMCSLANIFNKFGYSAKEIELRKKIIDSSKTVYGEDNDKTIMEMEKLVLIFRWEWRYEEAIRLREEILDIVSKHCSEDDEKIYEKIFWLARILEEAGEYEKALPLRRKRLDFYKNKDEKSFFSEAYFLIQTLDDLEKYDEKIELQKQIIEFHKNKENVNYVDISKEMIVLAITYKKINMEENANVTFEEILKYKEKIISNFITKYDETNIKEIKVIDDILDILDTEIKEEEIEEWDKKLELEIENWGKKRIEIINKFIYSQHTRKFNYENLEKINDILLYCIGHDKLYNNPFYFDEIIKILIDAVEFLKNNRANSDKIIKAMEDLSYLFSISSRYDEELDIHQQILRLLKEQENINWSELIKTMEKIANIFGRFNRYDEELDIREQILSILKEHKNQDLREIINTMKKIADISRNMNRYDEELNYVKKYTIKITKKQ